ncbi:ABC transporter family substrate-binding protein [Tessaracoccus flavus]|uniref:ABC transporter substrate-binding protein n=1 Tax=Tessaracoccus flavus TaxID=1610493 RepID=A0A1Q2CGB3_9ACTN|nr:ABC transporter family substrate-binding protein [Tessaracoccus flavus]AQP45085.1 ABC transporter substrate-binding protein [Tessaracoccus flavus]SDY56932.1 peptide/nickel transport system substrate-binding protein [Tessaracoccus flavus]
MKFRGTTATLGVVLSGALLLGACTSAEPTDPTTTAGGTETTATTETTSAEATATATETSTGGSAAGNPEACLQDVGITETQDGDVRYTAGPGDWSGYNSITSKTYSTYNSAVAAHMFSSFVYFGTDGTICDNTEFGTYEVVSEDPLEIKYTISDEAVWSDGTPVTINDYLLDWAAQNPEFLVPGYASGENPDATPVFDHVSSSFAQYVPEGPQGEVGSKEFTVTYSDPYPDYKLIVGSALPAHVVANKAGIEPDALAQAVLDRDAETITSAADFWNNGWMYNPGELPADMADVPSSGPYKLKEGGWSAGQSITLEANENYWGTPAGTRNLVFRFIEDAGQVQALQNGDVQAIEPQGTVDLVGQLEAIGDAVTVESASSLTWEHLDFNFRESNVFSDAQGGLALRQAFAYCVPRQQIVDQLIKPINPDAVIMNAREVFPFQDTYQEVVDAAYNGEYDTVDIEKAKALIAESGIATPIDVRVGYRSGNQRRTDIVAAIAASCKDAGFNVIDANSADFFGVELPNGDYEVALFAWAGSGQIASGQNIYASGRPQNYGEYSNAEVDAAWEKLATTLDESVQLEATKEIEKLLWDTLYGIPVFAHPDIMAYDSNLKNVRGTATQDGISWNAPQWQNA